MGAQAPQVCVDARDVQRLVALIAQLPAHGHVKLHMRDGSVCEGVVRTRPNVQVFRDPKQTEGINVKVSLAYRTPGFNVGRRKLTHGAIRRVLSLQPGFCATVALRRALAASWQSCIPDGDRS